MTGVKEAFASPHNALPQTFDDILPGQDRVELSGIAKSRAGLIKHFFDDLARPDYVGVTRLSQLRAVIFELSQGNLNLAEDSLRLITVGGTNEAGDHIPPWKPVTLGFNTSDAFNPRPVNYRIRLLDGPSEDGPLDDRPGNRPPIRPPGRPPVDRDWIDAQFPAYRGLKPSTARGERLESWVEFLTLGSEYGIRINLLRAEILVEKRQFDEAISTYNGLFVQELLAAIPIGSPRRKFIALRLASAYMGRGDKLFRKRVLQDTEREKITKDYALAMRVLQENGVSPDNPLRRQVDQYTTMQMEKLTAGLNFIGYRDSYVPFLIPNVLRELAETRIRHAEEAIEKFEIFKSKAEQIKAQLDEMRFEQTIKTSEMEIAAERVNRAQAQHDTVEQRINQIESQQDALEGDLVVGLGSSILQGVAAGFWAGQGDGPGPTQGTNATGVAGAVGGVASAITGYFARQDDLRVQMEIARVESSIAARDVRIAEIEQQILERTLDFLGEKISRIVHGELTPDLYFASARAFHGLAERHLDAAITHAYLFERAVAFLRLKPELEKIAFDYLPLRQEDQPENRLTAAARLKADLSDVIAENLPITKFQFLPWTYSLRHLYPLEFSRFLQTGDMDFPMSLYQQQKLWPDVYWQRIKRVEVVVRGLIPITGYTGRIIHRGNFLLRDKDTTPEPGAGNFLPTAAQLVEAVEELKNGGAGAIHWRRDSLYP